MVDTTRMLLHKGKSYFEVLAKPEAWWFMDKKIIMTCNFQAT